MHLETLLKDIAIPLSLLWVRTQVLSGDFSTLTVMLQKDDGRKLERMEEDASLGKQKKYSTRLYICGWMCHLEMSPIVQALPYILWHPF